jgi:hypothetical protein
MEKQHAIEDARSRDRSLADPGIVCTRPKQLERRFRQHQLHRLDQRSGRKRTRYAAKLGSERHWPNAGADARSVVHFSVELRHAGNRLKRCSHSVRDRPQPGAYTGPIHLGTERIEWHDRDSTTIRLRNPVDAGLRYDQRRHAANCGGSECAEDRWRRKWCLLGMREAHGGPSAFSRKKPQHAAGALGT